jgi:REP element-mobilizing transposase RayT
MARKLRMEYEGAIYHVMNRGDRREEIFKDDEDRQRFLVTLSEACIKTGWQVHALCLMPNHFHLLVETPQPNLVAGMKWLLVKGSPISVGGQERKRILSCSFQKETFVCEQKETGDF